MMQLLDSLGSMNWKTGLHWLLNVVLALGALLCLYIGLFGQSPRFTTLDRVMTLVTAVALGGISGWMILYTIRRG
jgi:hypothetical protein